MYPYLIFVHCDDKQSFYFCRRWTCLDWICPDKNKVKTFYFSRSSFSWWWVGIFFYFRCIKFTGQQRVYGLHERKVVVLFIQSLCSLMAQHIQLHRVKKVMRWTKSPWPPQRNCRVWDLWVVRVFRMCLLLINVNVLPILLVFALLFDKGGKVTFT